MGADQADFKMESVWHDFEVKFDTELSSSGIEISLDELESKQGLLSIRGRQVILFIPDHSFKFPDTMGQPEKGNKFHIADCRTLDSMKRKNRFERYKVTNNLSGVFEIFGSDVFGNYQEGEAKLNVCKNCLNMLNYKGATNQSVPGRNNIVYSFNIEEFFSIYSSIFTRLPKQNIQNLHKGYTADWDDVSSKARTAANFICQSCSVDLSQYKKFLHTHHKNGEKSDNHPSNLEIICADCHRKEPYHNHMFVKHEDTQLINRLRREQNRTRCVDWSTTVKLADLSLHGVINHCIKSNYEAAEVAYKVKASNGVTCELELAWPKRKLGVMIDQTLAITGWKILSLVEALEYFKVRA